MDAVLMILFLFACEVAAQRSWIGWMRARHVSQVQKAYGTRIDEEVKAKVPSMGGVVFLAISAALIILFGLNESEKSKLKKLTRRFRKKG